MPGGPGGIAHLASPVWTDIVFNLGLMAVAAACGGLAARAARLPSILGFIVAGLVAGPLLHLVQEGPLTEAVAELGVAFLLFFVGLELSVAEVQSVGRTAVVGGLAQVVATFLLGTLLGFALGFGTAGALLAGVAVSFSSTVVTVKVLSDSGDLSAFYGRSAIGILLVQDLVAMLALAIVAGLQGGSGGTPLAASLEAGQAILSMLLILAGVLLAARYVLPRFLQWVDTGGEAIFVASLAWLFLVMLSAQGLGLSVEAGAFVAGVGLAQLPYRDELRRRVSPLLLFFIAFFFVLTGVEIHPEALPALAVPILAFTAFSLVVKPLVLSLALPRAGLNRADTLRTSLSLVTTSEFGILLVSLAATRGLADESLAATVTAVALLTMMIGAPLQAHNARLARRLLQWAPVTRLVREPRKEQEPPQAKGVGLEDHVVVVGSGVFTDCLVERLTDRGIPVAFVTPKPVLPREMSGAVPVYGTPEDPDVLEQAAFRAARIVVSTVAEPGLNHQLLTRCHGITPFAARAETHGIARALETRGASFTVSPREAAANALIEHLEEGDVP